MANPVKPYTFVEDTDIIDDEVNANFDALFDWIRDQAIHADASKAFSAIPSGPSQNPTTNNQLTRKKYVDDEIAAATATVSVVKRWKVSGAGHDAITTSYFDIPTLEFTYTFTNGRLYEFRATGHLDWPSGSQGYLVAVREGSSTLALLGQSNNATGAGLVFDQSRRLHTLSGTRTLKLGIASVSGTVNLNGDLKPTELLLIDHGPAPA
jgi:hypothetical protein